MSRLPMRSIATAAFLAAVLATVRLVLLPHAAADTQAEEILGGLEYSRIEEEGVIAHVLRVSLREKKLFTRSLKAEGKETLRTMVERLNNSGERVVGAINGDFFRQETEAGIPHGVQVSDGNLIFGPSKRSMIGFGNDNRPYIGVVGFKGEVRFGKSLKALPIDAVNVFPNEFKKRNGVLLYTPAFLALKATRYIGLVATVKAIRPSLQVGDYCRGKIGEVATGVDRLDVPKDGCLLYFLGDHSRLVDKLLKPGLDVRLKLSLPPIRGGVPQAISGGPRLVRKGKASVEFDREDFATRHALYLNGRRHPRSAVGYDRAKKHLFLTVIEGRHAGSRGMTMGELALFMKKLTCYEAMSFDGGGSSALYVLDRGIASSTGEERAIANSLLITTERPPEAPKLEGETEDEGEDEGESDDDVNVDDESAGSEAVSDSLPGSEPAA